VCGGAGTDLLEKAEQGKLDPVIGRDEEIRRVIQVLAIPVFKHLLVMVI
jgi:ATP-dependent Clp protease ATP-binding subunit ClpB